MATIRAVVVRFEPVLSPVPPPLADARAAAQERAENFQITVGIVKVADPGHAVVPDGDGCVALVRKDTLNVADLVE